MIVPWTLHKMYGDTAVLDRHFGAMTRWMAYLERANPGYLRTRELGNSYNDWLAPADDKTPAELLASAYWAHDAALMAEMADATGHAGEAARYRALLAKLRSAFIDAFVAADGQVTSGTQTAYVLALHMDLIPEELREAAVRGPVASGWRRDSGQFTFSLDLPPNVTASVRIPSDDPAAVRDQAGAGPVSVAGYPGAPGAQEAVFAVGPGSHEFTGPALTAEFPDARPPVMVVE